jgi:hypothetical protein
MTTTKEEKYVKGCDAKTRDKRIESIDDLLSAINLIFIQNMFEEGEDDTALLHHLHKAKLKALDIKPKLTLVNETHLLINKILEGVDDIDINKEWNHQDNKSKFVEIKQVMTKLRLCYLLWKLNRYDIEKYSTCLCPNCDSIDVAGGKTLKKLGELTLEL